MMVVIMTLICDYDVIVVLSVSALLIIDIVEETAQYCRSNVKLSFTFITYIGM